MRIYVAGPYTQGDVAVNVAKAVDAGTIIAELGHHPFIPHLSHFWHFRNNKPYEYWLAQDLEWLKACHAVYRLPGPSDGADRECALATAGGIPVFTSMKELVIYLNSGGVDARLPVARIDYRALLKKYMAVVAAAEGVTFVNDADVGRGEGDITADELDELNTIDGELTAEWKGKKS